MFHLDRVCYLRWVRGLAAAGPARVPLTFSGMLEPETPWLEGIPAEELLAFDGADHPALAAAMAAEWGLAPEQVVLLPGSHFSILMLLLQRLSEVDGPVVVEEPAYEPLWRIPEALGVEILRWPRPRGAEFGLDPEALDDLASKRPSAVIVSHPHNPSGATLQEADRQLLKDLAGRTGAMVLSDEVYLEFEEDPRSATLLGLTDDTVAIRSFTKVFGLGSIRCSAVAGPARRIAGLAAGADYANVLLPSPTRVVAGRAWERREELWDRARKAAAAGRKEVAAFLARAEGRVEAYLPASGIICFPRLSGPAHEAAVAAARRRGATVDGATLPGIAPAAALWIDDLMRRTGIQLTPGEFFGDDRAFRIGFGIDPALLREGLDGIAHWLEEAMEEA